jgi:hypothetical protein
MSVKCRMLKMRKAYFFENNNTKQWSNKEIFGRQDMKKTAYLDKDEKKLAESLEKDKWISDLDKKEKNNMKHMPAIALTNKNGSTYE